MHQFEAIGRTENINGLLDVVFRAHPCRDEGVALFLGNHLQQVFIDDHSRRDLVVFAIELPEKGLAFFRVPRGREPFHPEDLQVGVDFRVFILAEF